MDTYDFEAKAQYRTRREIAIDRMVGAHRACRRVAYLDTGEALDTMSYLRRGYRPENLWPINRNAAEVAVLTRTLRSAGYPDVNTVGLDFEDALSRRVPEVDVIDFDGMAQLHDDLIEMLGRISAERPFAIYGVTLLAGRESNQGGVWRALIRNPINPAEAVTTSFGQRVNGHHHERVKLILMFGLNGRPMPVDPIDRLTPGQFRMVEREHGFGAVGRVADYEIAQHQASPCRVHVDRVMWDTYRSASGQVMCWLVAKCRPHEDLDWLGHAKLSKRTGVVPHCALGEDWPGHAGRFNAQIDRTPRFQRLAP